MSTTEVRSFNIPVQPGPVATTSGDTLLWTVAQRDGEGTLLPTVFASPSGSQVLAGHDPVYLRKSAQQLVPDVEFETMQMSLEDLTQIVAYGHGQLLWVDGELEILLPAELCYLLRNSGLLPGPHGSPTIYSGEVVPLADEAGDLSQLTGGLQRWDCPHGTLAPPDNSDLPSRSPAIWVYDDELDWSPVVLPDGARPRSELCPNGQQLFTRVLVDANPPVSAQADTYIRSPLIPASLLGYFNRLYAEVEQLIPPADQLQLKLTSATEAGETDTRLADCLLLDIVWPAGEGHLNYITRDWYLPSELQRDPELPSETGTYPMPQALRERLVRHVSWALLHHSQRFEACHGRLMHSLPGFSRLNLSNSDDVFYPDNHDNRFPFLARANIAGRELAVLIHGQIRSNFVCQPLEEMELPASEVPPQIPRWQDLVCPEEQTILLWQYNLVLLPATMVDFPPRWYQGVRLHEQYLVYLLRKEMLELEANDELIRKYSEEEARTPVTRHAAWAAVIAALLVLAVMLLDH